MDIPKDLKIAQEEIIKKYDETINASHEQFKDTHTKKEFTFTVTEKRRLAQQEAVKLIAEQASSDIIYSSVFPRIGVEPNADSKILYDPNVGRITVWTPIEKKDEPVIKTQAELVKEVN